MVAVHLAGVIGRHLVEIFLERGVETRGNKEIFAPARQGVGGGGSIMHPEGEITRPLAVEALLGNAPDTEVGLELLAVRGHGNGVIAGLPLDRQLGDHEMVVENAVIRRENVILLGGPLRQTAVGHVGEQLPGDAALLLRHPVVDEVVAEREVAVDIVGSDRVGGRIRGSGPVHPVAEIPSGVLARSRGHRGGEVSQPLTRRRVILVEPGQIAGRGQNPVETAAGYTLEGVVGDIWKFCDALDVDIRVTKLQAGIGGADGCGGIVDRVGDFGAQLGDRIGRDRIIGIGHGRLKRGPVLLCEEYPGMDER